MRRSLFVAALLVALNAAAQTRSCQLVRTDELSVRPHPYAIVVDGEIDGKRVGILLDTSAWTSMVHGAAARRLELKLTKMPGYEMRGVAAAEAVAEVAMVGELKLGRAARKNLSILVGVGGNEDSDFALVLGHDFFSGIEVEFDLANNKVNLFRALDCGQDNLAYWAKDGVEVVPLDPPMTSLMVQINGQPVRAMLDSAAATSLLDLSAAARFGVDTSSSGTVPAGCTYAKGHLPLESWTAPFATFAIGRELIRDPKIRIGDMHRGLSQVARSVGNFPEIILGLDFLRSHRVLVAHTQGRMYFTYARGTVFPASPPRACAELPQRFWRPITR